MAAEPVAHRDQAKGLVQSLVRPFLRNQVSLMLIVLAALLGAFALVATPREDRVRPSLPREAALSNAPDADLGCFRVPKVIEG